MKLNIYREPPSPPALNPGDVVTLINGADAEPVHLLVSTVTPEEDGSRRITFWPAPSEVDNT